MTTGQIIFYAGVALLAVTVILAVLFMVKKPEYHPENAASIPNDNRTMPLRNGYPTDPLTVRRDISVKDVEETMPLAEETTPLAEATGALAEATGALAEATASLTEETVPLTAATAPLTEETTPLTEPTMPLTEKTAMLAEATAPLFQE